MTSNLHVAMAMAVLVAVPAGAQQQESTRARAAPIPEQQLVAQLTKSLDSLATAGQFSGITVLVKNGAPIFQHAYGMADREGARSNNIETAFNLGSINKAFTLIAVMQLRAAGKLDLDSTLATYMPDYPNQEVAHTITIRQLLRHTSGIGGNIFGTPAGGKRSDIRRLQDYLPLFVNEPIQFEPGTRNAYSNAGYVVLGLLIERLSGEDYYTYVRRYVYEPAGMTRTAAYTVDSLPPNTAIGYTRGDSDAPPGAPLHRNTAELPGRGSSAGGGYSTAQDLTRFIQALRAHKIPGGPPAGLGIAGGSGGMNAVVEGELPGDYDLIVLANLDPPAAERVARMVRGWLGAKD